MNFFTFAFSEILICTTLTVWRPAFCWVCARTVLLWKRRYYCSSIIGKSQTRFARQIYTSLHFQVGIVPLHYRNFAKRIILLGTVWHWKDFVPQSQINFMKQFQNLFSVHVYNYVPYLYGENVIVHACLFDSKFGTFYICFLSYSTQSFFSCTEIVAAVCKQKRKRVKNFSKSQKGADRRCKTEDTTELYISRRQWRNFTVK